MTYKDELPRWESQLQADEEAKKWHDAQFAFLEKHVEMERKLKRRNRIRKIKMFLWLVLAWVCFLGFTLWPLIAPLIHKFTA